MATRSLHADAGPRPLDGGYSWVIAASAFVYHATTPGLLSLYGLVVLKSLREDDHDETQALRIWDVDVALVPFVAVVMRLLLAAWAGAAARTLKMPRLAALAGVCATVAGVLLSSFATNVDENDHIVSVFAGIFIGVGWALTGEQTEEILTHYFRDKLTLVQRLVRLAPAVGHALTPPLVAALCARQTTPGAILVYGAILMQNCFFLFTFTRPVYKEAVPQQTYNFMRDDEDEVFSQSRPQATTSRPADEDDQVVVFASTDHAAEIVADERRFSSDFAAMRVGDTNRFSSDFSAYDIGQLNRPYQELASIDHAPRPLYRATTTADAVDAAAVSPETAGGTARRTASVRKNLITLANMLKDVHFYLYTLLHLCTTFSSTVLVVVFPALYWERNPAASVWGAAAAAAAGHGAGCAAAALCVALPPPAAEYRTAAALCALGALGFYGVTAASNATALAASAALGAAAAACGRVLRPPLASCGLNAFDGTATAAAADAAAAAALLAWSLSCDHELGSCFLAAACLQLVTACVLVVGTLRRRR